MVVKMLKKYSLLILLVILGIGLSQVEATYEHIESFLPIRLSPTDVLATMH